MCRKPKEYTTRGLPKKKTRRDAHTHSLGMKLLPRTEIGLQQQRNTHKSGKRQRPEEGKKREEGEGEETRQCRNDERIFWVNDSIKCGFLISLCVARFHLPTGCYATPTCCCRCSVACRLPPPASHTLPVACNMKKKDWKPALSIHKLDRS